jgi:hypothetical protein
MPPSLRTAAPNQASKDAKPREIGSNFSRNGAAYSQDTTNSNEKKRASNPLGLILYITCVTIVDQNLNLERDRFSLVDNLFENGQLIESRIQKLVFGNPQDNKPTFLWFFDDTSGDKPRSIKNRPSAEAAIAILRARAERAEATGIQLFDAPDRDTAALVPVHEATRKDDFVERVSFELEIDNEENDDDEDDMEEAEKASKVDSAYESRDGELQLDDLTSEREPQLDDVAVKEEFGDKPSITWAGQQQENKVESESESDEDEDIGSFYR